MMAFQLAKDQAMTAQGDSDNALQYADWLIIANSISWLSWWLHDSANEK